MGIDKEQIAGKKITIAREVLHLDKYDMYYVKFPMKDGTIRQVRVFCEKGTFPDRESEQFKEYQRRYGRELIAFFVDSLVGKESLMAEQKREDFIYLGGEFMQNGYLANRFMIQQNGKTGQENFDANLFKIKQRVLAMENRMDNKQNQGQVKVEGKHYAISDVHGMYGSYMEAISKLNENDKLFVLGDVIDRGSNGIEILLDIMSRKNVGFILGNHEWQMIRVLDLIKKHKLNFWEIQDYCNAGQWIRYEIEDTEEMRAPKKSWENDVKYQERVRNKKDEVGKWKKRKEEILAQMKRVELTEDEMDLMYIWIVKNEGELTLFKYLSLPEEKQNEIDQFLRNAITVARKQIGNQKICLVHAAPPQGAILVFEREQKDGAYTYSMFEEKWWLRECTQNRNADKQFAFANQYGYKTIYGHTPKARTY